MGLQRQARNQGPDIVYMHLAEEVRVTVVRAVVAVKDLDPQRVLLPKEDLPQPGLGIQISAVACGDRSLSPMGRPV